MKKIVSMLLCVAILLSALTLFAYAVEDKGSTQSPVIDGVVDVGEYISERVFDNTDADTGLPNTSGNHVDFAAGGIPAAGVTITEYASEDEENIYIAFVVNQDFINADVPINGRAEAASTMAEHLNVVKFFFNLESTDETEGTVTGSSGRDATSTKSDGTEMRAYRASECDSIAKRNKSGDVFQNITIEIKISKEAIKDVCNVDSVEFIGYWLLCRDMNKEYANEIVAQRKDINLCSRPLNVTKANSGFSSFQELTGYYVGAEEHSYYSTVGWKTLRFICFYEEPAVKAWYGPEGTMSSAGVERAPVLNYTDFGRHAATSTYVYSNKNVAPVVDGVVKPGEYTSSKVYNQANQFTNRGDTSVTVTEYVAHDSEYVYFALVYNTDMAKIQVRMNGQERVRYDLAATEYIYQFIYDFATAGADELSVSPSRTNFDTAHVFDAAEYEGIGKKNKSGGEVVATTVELKLSKTGMKRVFEVSSVDYFGYYGESTTASSKTITNAAVFNNIGLMANEWTTSAELATEYGLDTSNYKSRIMNIVVLSGETLSETVPVYCDDAHKTCTYEGHANRAAKFDMSNTESLGRLKSNYIPTNIATAPTLNGDIGGEEYTNSRTINNTVEYAAHDDNYIYLAFVNPDDGTNWPFELFLNAEDNVFSSATAAPRSMQMQITTGGVTMQAAHSGITMFTPGTDIWTSMVRTGGNQIVEIKISKQAMKDCFGTDLERGFGYWARYFVNSSWVEVVNPITTYGACADATELSAAYGGMTVGGGSRYLNFVMFEEAPETPAIYCPANDVCEHESHDGKTFTFDFSNAESLGRLPSTYLTTNSTATHTIDGVISTGEYDTEKTIVNTIEYAAHDDEYIYLGFVNPDDGTNWPFEIYIDLDTDANLFGRIYGANNRYARLQIALNNGVAYVREHTEAGIDGRTFTEEELQLGMTRSGGKQTIEMKISKAGMERVFDTELGRGFGYCARYFVSSSWSWIVSPVTSYGSCADAASLAAAYGTTVASGTQYLNYIMFEEAPETPAIYCLSISEDELNRRAETFDIADMRCLNLAPAHFVETQLETPQVTPTIDGVVDPYEYTNSKYYFPIGNPPNGYYTNYVAGVTVTEYAAYDADYIYIALVYNTNMSRIQMLANGKTAARTDFLQAEYICYFNATSLGSVDEQKITASGGNFTNGFVAGEYEGIAKKNKNGETIVSTTFELKISREAMRRVFEVENADFIGYYADGTAVANGSLAGGTVTNATRMNGVTNLGWTAGSYTNATEAMAQSYGTTIIDPNGGACYNNRWRLLNFIMFGYEEPEVHNVYSPVGSADRAETLDLSDLVCLSSLPSNYVSSPINADVQTPTPDGVIKAGEYTNKKVYSSTAHFSGGCAPDNGATVTEYVSHDADYVYLAWVFTQDITNLTIRMNASANVVKDLTETEKILAFDFKLANCTDSTIDSYIDQAQASCSKLNFGRAFSSSEYLSNARRNKVGGTFNNLTAEIRISKEAIKDIFGVDSVDHIGYYAQAARVTAEGTKGGNIVNAARFNNLSACGWADTATFASAYGVDISKYSSLGRIMNFIIFDKEAPETHNIYCPASNCSVNGHANRATEFDLTDIVCFGALPSNYVSTVLDNGEKLDVFTVDISFGSMSFTYVDEGYGDWNSETHEQEVIPAHWECDEDENKVTVVNESEFTILTSFIYEKGEGFEGITGAFDNAVARLVGTEDEAYAEKSTVNAYLSLDGEFGSENAAETKLGQVTVKLTKANS